MTKKCQYLNLLINSFLEQLLSVQEKELIKYLLSDKQSSQEVLSLLANVDFEKISDNKLLFVAYFIKNHPELNIDNFLSSKIKSIKDFYMKRRLELYVHLDRIAEKFNEIKEVPMLLKGAAMSYLNPDLLRTMGDIDVLVSAEAFNKTEKFAKDLGYKYSKEPHSYDLHEKNSQQGIVDVHKYVYMDTKCEEKLNQKLWNRASKIHFLDRELSIPSFEDMLFISFINMARNLRNDTSKSSILYTFFDIKFILSNNHNVDWNILLENAKITNTLTQLQFAVHFIKAILPDVIPVKLFYLSDIEAKKLENYCLEVYFNRIFLEKLRQISRKLKIKHIFLSKKYMMDYIKIKPKYFLLKLISENQKLTEYVLKKSGVINE